MSEELTNEQKIELGEMASGFLNHPFFPLWHQIAMNRTIVEIDKAGPDHTKAVMWQKLKRQVISEVFADARSILAQAERIYQDMQEKHSPERKEQRRLDTQGFGLNFGQEEAS